MKPDGLDRRTFVGVVGSCAAHLIFTFGAATADARLLLGMRVRYGSFRFRLCSQ